MFIRQVKKKNGPKGKVFSQFTLVQAARVNGKVKQRNLLYLGSDPLLVSKENRSTVLEILKTKIFKLASLFPNNTNPQLEQLANNLYEKYVIKYSDASNMQGAYIPPQAYKAEFHYVDVQGLENKDVKTFGVENLCKQIMDKLELEICFRKLKFSKQDIQKSLISIVSRAIFCASEYRTAQYLEDNSSLIESYRYANSITYKQLYRISDLLYKHKDQIDKFVYKRISHLFNLEDQLVIFDISNSYFEGRKNESKLAQYGRSKEKRNDCKQVVFTGVINAEGFIRHSRIYEGNKADVTTLEDMITDLQRHSPAGIQQTIVMDAGIATQDNLQIVKDKGLKYVCVSRHRLKEYAVADSSKVYQLTDREKNVVELSVFKPAGYDDTWMYVQSQAKRRKEQSMEDKLTGRFEEDLSQVQRGIHTKGGTKRIEKIWERIGRIKQKHDGISGRYEINVETNADKATNVSWKLKEDSIKEDKANGVYFIRTNYADPSEKQLWKIYNTIREVESTFRCLKSDLQIRPIFHQNDDRTESHIYLTLLAYQLVNTIRHMTKQSGLHYDWQNIVRIMNTQTIQTMTIPTDKKTINLRKPSTPIQKVEEIYAATATKSTIPAIKKYVVYH